MPAAQQPSDSAYLQSLRERSEQWNSTVVSRFEAVQKDIDEVDRRWSTLLGPAEQEFFTRRKQLLLEYQSRLETIHRMQLDLSRKEDALLREPVYSELIAQYLACLSLEESLKQQASLVSEHAAVLEDMRQFFLEEKFAAIVNRYNQQASRAPGQIPGSELQLYYIVALSRLGYTAEAVQAVSQLSTELPLADCTNVALLTEAAEFLMKNGRPNEGQALQQSVLQYYQSQQQEYARIQENAPLLGPVADQTSAQKIVAQAAELFAQGGSFGEVYRLCIDALAACPDRSCQREVQTTLEDLVSRTVTDIDAKLNQIDLFIQQGRQEDARQLLSTLEPLLQDGLYPPLVMEKRALILQRKEAVFGSETSWQAEAEQQKFDEAVKLLENQKYEEAIALFNQLGEGPFADDAAENKRVAVDELARLNRTKAGNLFLQARQTTDPAMKKKYLLESYTLLKDTLLRYPENHYADKIRRNLEGVQTEMNRLYPGELLSEPPAPGGLLPGTAPVPNVSDANEYNP